MSIRFLILSDTHDTAFPDPESLPTVDILIHCGDLTQIGDLSEYKNTLEALTRCSAELKLVIPGNHDVSLDPVWWAKYLDEGDDLDGGDDPDGGEDPDEPKRAKQLFATFQSKGVRLLEEGTHRISLQDGRGLTVYASPYTPEYNGYAFAYKKDEDRFNTGAHPIPPEVDVVITHGPPMVPVTGYRLDKGRDGEHCGCPKLWSAIERTRPRLHCFGHIHEGYGSEVVRWVESDGTNSEDVSITESGDGHTRPLPAPTQGTTLLVNAAIMSHGGNNKKPWVVDIAL